jgi:hypothetical protein
VVAVSLPDLLAAFQASADLTNSPVPRTWANVARLLGLSLGAELEHAAIAGAVGEGAAAELLGFLRLFRDLPNIDGIILDPDAEPIPDQPAALYATVTALGSRASEQVFGSIARYAQRLIDAGSGEFATLLIRDAMRRAPEIKQTRAFVALASGDLGALLTGAA